jgi:hypothetical protein
MLTKWTSELSHALRTKNYCYFFDILLVNSFFYPDNLTSVYDIQTSECLLKIKYKTKYEVELDIDYTRAPKFLNFWKIPQEDDDDDDYYGAELEEDDDEDDDEYDGAELDDEEVEDDGTELEVED